MFNRRFLLLYSLIGCLLLVSCQTESSSPVPTPAAPAATGTPVPPSPQPAAAATPTAVATVASDSNGANADVLFVRAQQAASGSWTFHVTVAHPDTGWEDYADGWDVVLPDGTVLKPDPDSPFTRLLLHPHETEQPFTRSQSGIIIPAGTDQVRVRAHDLVDGFGGSEVVLGWSAAEAGTAVVTDLYEINPSATP